jgi:hypothetical protein
VGVFAAGLGGAAGGGAGAAAGDEDDSVDGEQQGEPGSEEWLWSTVEGQRHLGMAVGHDDSDDGE